MSCWRRRLRRRADGSRRSAARDTHRAHGGGRAPRPREPARDPFARRVFLSYAIAGRSGTKYSVTGRPIPVAHLDADRAAGRARFGLPRRARVLAVFGGLAGAQALNEFAVEAFGEQGPAVLHVSGDRDYDALRPKVKRSDYVPVATTDHFGEALAVADLAISRAGGRSGSLPPRALRRSSFHTPTRRRSSSSERRHFAEGGGAVILDQRELDRAPRLVTDLLGDGERLRE